MTFRAKWSVCKLPCRMQLCLPYWPVPCVQGQWRNPFPAVRSSLFNQIKNTSNAGDLRRPRHTSLDLVQLVRQEGAMQYDCIHCFRPTDYTRPAPWCRICREEIWAVQIKGFNPFCGGRTGISQFLQRPENSLCFGLAVSVDIVRVVHDILQCVL